MRDLRDKVIKLAHENPELREDLLPLLKQAARVKGAIVRLDGELLTLLFYEIPWVAYDFATFPTFWKKWTADILKLGKSEIGTFKVNYNQLAGKKDQIEFQMQMQGKMDPLINAEGHLDGGREFLDNLKSRLEKIGWSVLIGK